MSATVLFLKIALFAIPVCFGVLVFASFCRTSKLRELIQTPDREFSPARLQLLAVSVAAAGYFLKQVIESPDQSAMPALPPWLTAATIGSGFAYVTAKASDLGGLGAILRGLAR